MSRKKKKRVLLKVGGAPPIDYLGQSKTKKAYLKRNELWKAGGIFVGGIVICLFIISRLLSGAAADSLARFTAASTGIILNLFGAEAMVNGSLISSPDFSMGIILECTGLVPLAIFLPAIIAYPSSTKQKLVGVAIGIGGIYLVNLVRTVSLFYVGVYFPGFLDTAHFLVWQSLIMLFAIILWLLWAQKVAHAKG